MIVFLDTATVDLGDIDLSILKKQGPYRLFRNTEPSQIISHAKRAKIIVTNKCVMNQAILSQLPNLKLICVTATGVNNVDLDFAKQRGIAVTNVPGYSTKTVAEHTLLFLLAASHRLLEHHQASIREWSHSSHFAWLGYPFCDLHGKTLGLVGYGQIGKRVGRLAKTFGMQVMIGKIPGRVYQKSQGRVSLSMMLQKSDFVSLHCPLSRFTHHLMNQKHLALMKPTSWLLNMARGPIVDEKAVVLALKHGTFAGYATDVMEKEPPQASHPLFQKALQGKVILSPHIAWASRESRQKVVEEMAKNIQAFRQQTKRNRIV